MQFDVTYVCSEQRMSCTATLHLICPYLISFGPNSNGCWLSCDLHIQTELVARHHNDGVLGDHVSSGVQVDLWRIWLMTSI